MITIKQYKKLLNYYLKDSGQIDVIRNTDIIKSFEKSLKGMTLTNNLAIHDKRKGEYTFINKNLSDYFEMLFNFKDYSIEIARIFEDYLNKEHVLNRFLENVNKTRHLSEDGYTTSWPDELIPDKDIKSINEYLHYRQSLSPYQLITNAFPFSFSAKDKINWPALSNSWRQHFLIQLKNVSL